MDDQKIRASDADRQRAIDFLRMALESAIPAAMLPGSQPGTRRGMPAAVRVLWSIWAAAVSVNLAVWVLVCATTARLVYPWPLWVACPLGAVLLLVSACAADGRHRQPDPPRLPSGAR